MYVLPDALKGNTWAEMLRESVLYLVSLIFEWKITWWLMPWACWRSRSAHHVFSAHLQVV